MTLTWMDARVDGEPITQRAGKPVEVNALWISGLSAGATGCPFQAWSVAEWLRARRAAA